MHAMKLRVQALWAALESGARGALSSVGGRHNNVGCHCGKASHNASNSGDVTSGKMGRNSSKLNTTKAAYRMCCNKKPGLLVCNR